MTDTTNIVTSCAMNCSMKRKEKTELLVRQLRERPGSEMRLKISKMPTRLKWSFRLSYTKFSKPIRLIKMNRSLRRICLYHKHRNSLLIIRGNRAIIMKARFKAQIDGATARWPTEAMHHKRLRGKHHQGTSRAQKQNEAKRQPRLDISKSYRIATPSNKCNLTSSSQKWSMKTMKLITKRSQTSKRALQITTKTYSTSSTPKKNNQSQKAQKMKKTRTYSNYPNSWRKGTRTALTRDHTNIKTIRRTRAVKWLMETKIFKII